MAFDSAIATDWGTALADLRDKVGGLTNWAIEKDSSGGATSLAAGDDFVLSNPHGEALRVEFSSRNQSEGYRWLWLRYGASYDSANDAIDHYSRTFNTFWRDQGIAPLNADTHMNATDAVTYWLEYVDGGFCMYVQREEGDGDDGDLVFGLADINKLWDYSSAASLESHQIQLMGASNQGDLNVLKTQARMGESGTQPLAYCQGAVNPDANYNNFPYTEGIAHSGQYKNAQNDPAIIGDYDLMLRDDSGGDSAHRDTIQDSSGADVYTILKRNDVNCAIRMD